MKHCLLALSLSLAGTTAYAQQQKQESLTLPVDPETHQITYSRIIAVPGASQSELYARGTIWFGTAFYSIQNVILANNQPAGYLVGRGYVRTILVYGLIPLPIGVRVLCTIKLSFQEGRYRYILTDFNFNDQAEVGAHSSNLPPGSVEQICLATRPNGRPTHQAAIYSTDLDQAAQQLMSSIELGMSQATGGGAW